MVCLGSRVAYRSGARAFSAAVASRVGCGGCGGFLGAFRVEATGGTGGAAAAAVAAVAAAAACTAGEATLTGGAAWADGGGLAGAAAAAAAAPVLEGWLYSANAALGFQLIVAGPCPVPSSFLSSP